MRQLILLFVFPLFFISCDSCENEDDVKLLSECNLDIDTLDFSFGIDYADPNKYLTPGEESNLKDVYLEEIRAVLGTPSQSIEGILSICHWFNQNFTFSNAGGAMIGVNTVDELYEIKTFYGCHSAALIISSILREFGFPTVMIETASIQWAYDYRAGRTQNFIGHVMAEVYLIDKWILLDNNCTYVDDYDPLNPFILTANYVPHDYFVYAKGIDIWDYTGRDESFTDDKMVNFSANVLCYEELFYTVSYIWD